ncbi:hybrid sensor histidine kinase/response regulator [Lacisediminimonas profundi]|uniref:hybrid sensor histidine kinase/response regulator n=1 Tax=Lacisediminimonas profundi TaxID=2603856 RepID=UPI0013874B5D|nr:hybrid sensor histidine kinase/response regulator [Lacisediminimonas profundi]
MPPSPQLISQFAQEVEQRLGSVPALYRPTPETFAAVSTLWTIARAGWFDNSWLPTGFSQRLLVYLSLLSGNRYCAARHAAWLCGTGRILDSSGSASAVSGSTVSASTSQLIDLLQMPPPGYDEIRSATELLGAISPERAKIPLSGSPLEQSVFTIAGSLFLAQGDAALLRRLLVQALGSARAEQILLLISGFQAERQWVHAHPELAVDEDVAALLKREPEVAQLLDARLANIENRDRQRDRFLGMLGHELRNPVAAISAVSDMFQVVGVGDERLRNASSILHRQTRSLSQMLDNLVEMSSLVFGKVPMTKVPLVADDLLAGVLRQYESKFAEQGLTLTHTPADRRVYVMADRARLAQVFEQILSNASKFARSPGNLQIETQAGPKSLSIHFRDDGSGFSPEHAHAIFEPYAQAAPESLPKTSGLGIGLTIARMITVLQDGALEAVSAGPGKGATFTLRLPLVSQDANGKPEKKLPARPVSRMRVLVIEDNKDFAQLFRHMLEIMGCDLDSTPDARSGLKLAHERLPELIFCDIGLPGDMNGFDFARAVRADAQLAHIPLVAVSGHTSAEGREQAMAAGFDRVCAKPVKFADISDVLSACSAHRSAG